MKKLVSIILILVLLFLAVVPSYAVGESVVVAGLGRLATALGFSSVAPVIGGLVALVAGGLILTQTDIIPTVAHFFQTVFNPSMEENLTDLGSVPETTPSVEVVSAVETFVSSASSDGLPDGVFISPLTITLPKTSTLGYKSFASNHLNGYTPTFYSTGIPGIVCFYYAYGYPDSDLFYDIIGLVNLLNNTSTTYAVGLSLSTRQSSDPLTVTFNVTPTSDTVGRITPSFSLPVSSTLWSQSTYNSAFASVASRVLDRSISNLSVYNYDVTLFPNSGYNTSATAFAPGSYIPASIDTSVVGVLTDETVISVPTDWEYDDNEDVLTVPNVGALTPGLIIPSIPGAGSLSWEASPQWQDQSPDLPEWTYKIPLLGTIVRFLSWIGSLIKTLGEWLASLWDSIVGFFADVRQFFADFGNFARDLLDLLRGSDLARFLSAILSFLSGYTLYQGLFSAYLPQCIAVVLWAGWLVIMAFWILRLVLNR